MDNDSNPQARRLAPSAKERAAAAIAAAVLVATPLTAGFEGLRTKPYLDPAGIATVCYGETNLLKYDPSHIYAKTECGAMLRRRLAKDYAPRLLACLPQLTDGHRRNVFGALLDASYNAGAKAACNSPMAAGFRAGRWTAGCNAFPGWYVTARNRKTGVRTTLPGLVRRRVAERALCLKVAA